MSDNATRCKATNKQGQPCGAAATETGFCYFHANPHVVSQLGRVGGSKNRHVAQGDATPLPPLDSVIGVKKAIAQTIVDVHANRLSPRIAAGVAPLYSILLRALTPGEVEEEVKKLAKELDETKGKLKELEERESKSAADNPSGRTKLTSLSPTSAN